MNKTLAIGAALLGVASASNAQSIVFENLPDRANGAIADSSGLFPENRAADNFALASDDIIGSVQFWGLWLNNVTGAENFTAVIYDDAAGSPGSVIATVALVNTTSTLTGADVLGLDEYLHTADLATPFAVTAGTTYYLSIFNDSGLGDGGTWAWGTSDAEANGWLSTDFGVSFDNDTRIGGNAFRLVNIPSPASAALVGINALVVARRRRR